MANPLGSRTHANAQTYDVKVLAFPAASARTVQGLMQLFNIEQSAAERLVGSVPLLLSQGVSGPDAETCAQALRKLGARVVVEPSALPTAQSAGWSQANELEEDLLPQPRAVPIANDTELEYDVLSAEEPGYAEHASISTSLRDGLDMDLGTSEPDRMSGDGGLRRHRQESIDLPTEGHSHAPGLELDEPAPARQPKANPKPERARPQTRDPAGQHPAAGPHPAARPRNAEGPAPHARAAVVERADNYEAPSRTIPLLQLCFAMGVAAIGYWTDSSIIFGSASLWSVAAHGVALYQLALGVRGLTS